MRRFIDIVSRVSNKRASLDLSLLREMQRGAPLLLENRMACLRKNYIPRIAAVVDEYNVPASSRPDFWNRPGRNPDERNAARLLDRVAQADPDRRKKNTQWLLNRPVIEGFGDDFDPNNEHDRAAAMQRIIRLVRAFAKRVGVRAEFRQGLGPGELELTDLYAKEPGSGGGSKVMAFLGELCDRHDINVLCKPEQPRNQRFYARFGFVRSPRHFGMLVRYPPLPADDD